MRDVLDAPLHYDRREKGWQYTEDYDIGPHLGFSEQQFNKLRLGLEILERYEKNHLIDEKERSSIQQKFILADGNPYDRHIFFQKAPYYEGAALVGFFLEAIEKRRQVSFQYKSFKDPGVKKRRIHPYFLREWNNRWYLIGKLPDFEEAKVVYALDRILQDEYLRILEEGFERDLEFTFEEFFRNTYGVTVLDKPVEEVTLLFQPLQARFFQSKPFFPYETLEETREGLKVCMKIIPNFEFIRKIMSFGNGVEVLAPESLRNSLKEAFTEALSLYKPGEGIE
jgi:predicted DNA-binding transcriptional regulator YafY